MNKLYTVQLTESERDFLLRILKAEFRNPISRGVASGETLSCWTLEQKLHSAGDSPMEFFSEYSKVKDYIPS